MRIFEKCIEQNRFDSDCNCYLLFKQCSESESKL